MAPLHVATLTVQRELPKYENSIKNETMAPLHISSVPMAPLHVTVYRVLPTGYIMMKWSLLLELEVP